MMMGFYWQLLLWSCFICIVASQNNPHFYYTCKNNLCVREPIGVSNGTGLYVCRLICDPNASLWPLPTGKVDLNAQSLSSVDISRIAFINSDVPADVLEYLQMAQTFFLSVLTKTIPVSGRGGVLQIRVSILSMIPYLTLQTSENYSLILTNTGGTINAVIEADTFFGARHALETLSQLIVYDETTDLGMMITNGKITDGPKYPYRGILLDTSRQFVPIDSIYHLVDSMSYNKLNYFHWHLTDSSSFTFQTFKFPLMNKYGLLEPHMIYTQAQIVDLVKYARSRGVVVIPELDAPAHAGNGWQWGPEMNMGNLAYCVNEAPWTNYCVEPPCGQLSPINENVTKTLNGIYQEMLSAFNVSMFHMGGDEVKLSCWNSSQEIIDWLAANGRGRTTADFLRLWAEWQQSAYSQLSSDKEIIAILWTSDLTSLSNVRTYLPTSDYIIEVWDFSTTNTIPTLLAQNYSIIISNADAWYLDCGFGGWVDSGNNWCSPYKEWQLIYDNRPYKSLNGNWVITDPAQLINIMGGEVSLWTEEADGLSMDSRIWPRAAASAERLWSDPTTDWLPADDRMQLHRYRLVNRGIGADTLQPYWCLQNQGLCTLQTSYADL